MHTLRLPLLALVLLAALLSPLTALAQTAAVIPGKSTLAFDHDGTDVTRYELCVGATCTPIIPAPAKDGSANVFRFVAPATLPSGPQVLAVRAVGEAGVSAPSEPVTFRVVVIPAQPGPLRVEVANGGE